MDVMYYVLLGVKGFMVFVGFLLAMLLFLLLGSLIGKLFEIGQPKQLQKGDEKHEDR